jgi:small subunit ribosomal protein S10
MRKLDLYLPYIIKIMPAKKDQSPKLRIKLKSYDVRMLEASVGKVISLLIKSGAEVKGPIPLPKKRKVYTVLRSNFKFKSSREQFERISYTRMIDVTETGAKTVEYLQNLSIPVGILVDIKVF